MQPPAAPAFVELCTRSAFSGITEGSLGKRGLRGCPGAVRPEALVVRVSSLGQKAFALTDLFTLAGIGRAEDKARELGVRLIVGCEVWMHEGPVVLHVED